MKNAEANGVFGVPTILIDNEMFFGGDQLQTVRERIQTQLTERAELLRGAIIDTL